MSTFRRQLACKSKLLYLLGFAKDWLNLFVANSLSTNTLLYISKDYP